MSVLYQPDSSSRPAYGIWLLALCVVSLLVWLGPSACTRPDDARRILTASGYTEIEITGWRPFAASQDDSVSTGFRAKSPSGQIVTGTVSGGMLFKGGTVRLD